MHRTKSNQKQKFDPLRPILQFPSILKIILKRQRHYLVLTLLALVNVVLAVGLITSASFFSQAVDRVVLLQELREFTSVTGRPPLSTSIYIFPSRRQPITLEKAEELAQHIAQIMAGEVGLPVQHLGIEVTSGNLTLQPAPDSTLFAEGKNNLGSVNTAYVANVAGQMKIIEGQPLDEDGASGEVVDVWMHEAMAQSMGAHIGEKLILSINMNGPKTPVQVAGIWRAEDPQGPFWFNNPDSAFKTSLIVRRSDYIQSIQPMLGSGAGQVSWYVVLDENEIAPKHSEAYLLGFERSLELINRFLPGARMNMPPLDPLEEFVDRSSTLTVLLLGYNLPAFAILLYFLALTSAVMAQWQRRETVMLVSRGMSITGVLSLTLVEQVVLFVAGYPIGLTFGMTIAWLMGYTESFLAFTSRAALPVSLEGFNLPLTVLALCFALFTRLMPALRAARSSLVTEERERARPMRKPFWFRFYLDLVLLIPTYYAYDQMIKRGSLAGLVTDRPEDLFRDPLLIVVPALFILTASLVTMRVFTWLMRLVDLLAGRIQWLTLHLTLRQLGRQSLDYVRPLLLVIIALGMGVYTISMAASLDQWMVDRIYYANGADYVLTPNPAVADVVPTDGNWIPLPYAFETVPGVQDATRVAEFPMAVDPDTRRQVRGRFLAVDRAEFASVAWFRQDFAREPLGAMMNRLAPVMEGVLVSEEFLRDRQLRVGDTLLLRVDIRNIASIVTDFMIVGTYRYFPTVYEEDQLTIIGNLDLFSTLTGVIPEHTLWMRLAPGTDTQTLAKNIAESQHIAIRRAQDARGLIRAEQERMERVGIFGTLTAGFIATAVMSILGLLVYSYASLQDRAYRLAVLNAVGLSRRQILVQVIFEYAFLALFGALAGALIGMLAADLFVPFFRFTGTSGVPLPPLLPVISASQPRILSLAFGLTIIVVEVITMGTILHNRLVQIMKRVWM